MSQRVVQIAHLPALSEPMESWETETEKYWLLIGRTASGFWGIPDLCSRLGLILSHMSYKPERNPLRNQEGPRFYFWTPDERHEGISVDLEELREVLRGWGLGD